MFLQKTPISFDVSVRELFFAFTVGAELVFAEPGGHRDTQYLAQLIASRGITCCSFVPSQLEIFLQVQSNKSNWAIVVHHAVPFKGRYGGAPCASAVPVSCNDAVNLASQKGWQNPCVSTVNAQI